MKSLAQSRDSTQPRRVQLHHLNREEQALTKNRTPAAKRLHAVHPLIVMSPQNVHAMRHPVQPVASPRHREARRLHRVQARIVQAAEVAAPIVHDANNLGYAHSPYRHHDARRLAVSGKSEGSE